ncbi:MAG: multidrug ABC transporter [Bacteroidaceae bacterium]|nr:multidrug ABC transporter [Bacteroidaceae bacterium]
MSDKNILLYSCLILLGTFVSAISQVMLKKAANREYDNPIKEYLNPLVIGAYTIFVLTTFLGIFAYRVVPLSYGPILEATSYIYITFFGVNIFHEKINKTKLIALALIVAGIVIYAI